MCDEEHVSKQLLFAVNSCLLFLDGSWETEPHAEYQNLSDTRGWKAFDWLFISRDWLLELQCSLFFLSLLFILFYWVRIFWVLRWPNFCFRGFSTLTKIENCRKLLNTLLFFPAHIGCQCVTLHLHLLLLLLFSAFCLYQQNILSCKCVHSVLGHLPPSSHILLCFAAGAEWVYLRGSMVLRGGGGGLVCVGRCRDLIPGFSLSLELRPWLSLPEVAAGGWQRCNTQQCVGVRFVI